MKTTISKTKINSTNGQHYFRIKVYSGKGSTPKYISLNDLKLWNNPNTESKRATNRHNKVLVDEKIEALKRVANSANYLNTTKEEKFFNHVDFVAKNRGSSSIKNQQIYSATKQHLENYCREQKLSSDLMVGDINYDFCIGFKTFLSKTSTLRSSYANLSEASQNTYFVRLCVIMNDAISRGLISSTPTSKIKAPPIPDKEIVYLTYSEIKTLEETPCSNPMLKNAFLFAFYTGLRKGDIETLKWKNLPIINSIVELDLITGKKGVRLTYKLPIQATEFLKNRGEENENVFSGFKYDGYQNEKLRTWVASAGIRKDNVGSHTARHSFAVYHLSKGTPIYTLSKLMAHNSVRTTERSYAQYAKEDLNYALDKAFN
jgi:integrase